MSARPIIALTTDFGGGSAYVAQLKGVLLSRLPDARVLDLSHDLPPYDLRAAELFLRSAAFALPIGTVHLVVIDPGVGGPRRPIAAQTAGLTFVGPDNGVLGRLANRPGARVVLLDRPGIFRAPLAPTFHGRDLFAPVAAELAGGLTLDDVGTSISDPQPSTLPEPQLGASEARGETLGADRFGNLTTNLLWSELVQRWPRLRVALADTVLPVVRTYHEAQGHGLVALEGSDGYLEIARREYSAAALLQGERGHPVFCGPADG